VNRTALVGVTIALAGCPHRADHKTPRRDASAVATAGDAAASTPVVLPPAPPVPREAPGLPALPSSAALDAITPDQLALGELLFWDGRLATDGKTACATCHDPAHGYAGSVAIDKTAAGEPNRRHTPALVNLAWAREYGWDGRFTSLGELMAAHVKGQLGQDLDTAMTKLSEIPTYAAHLARVGGTPGDAALHALEAFVLTRYDGDSPWDRLEPSARTPKPTGTADPVIAGYLVFTGKGQCALCHTPPLYTDFEYHVVDPQSPDEGRGKVDPNQRGAMRTPTLRGAAARSAFFHDGRLATLEQAIDAHPPTKIPLTADERAHLLAFVRALTADRPPLPKPVLP
jgi:cytochrome c peroxidase